MLDMFRLVAEAVGRAWSILSNHGERADRYAWSTKPDEGPDGSTRSEPLENCAATHVEIRFTVDDEWRAEEITGMLLDAHLVACGQRVGPIHSRYWWQGALEESEEWLVLLKTRAELADRVVDTVARHHPYDTAEVVAVPIVVGLDRYLDWIDGVTGDAGSIPRGSAREEHRFTGPDEDE